MLFGKLVHWIDPEEGFSVDRCFNPHGAVIVGVAVLDEEERYARPVGQVAYRFAVRVKQELAVDVSVLNQRLGDAAVVFAQQEVDVYCWDVVSPGAMFEADDFIAAVVAFVG